MDQPAAIKSTSQEGDKRQQYNVLYNWLHDNLSSSKTKSHIAEIK